MEFAQGGLVCIAVLIQIMVEMVVDVAPRFEKCMAKQTTKAGVFRHSERLNGEGVK